MSHKPRSRGLRWVLAKARKDRLAETFLIIEVGTDLGPWFAIADALAELLADELREDVLEHRIDEAL
jgi:hypothetical protein